MYETYTVLKRNHKWCVKTPEGWQMYHRFIMEQIYEPIPEGYLVMFLDGDSTNVSIANLAVVKNGIPPIIGHVLGYCESREGMMLKIKQAELIKMQGDLVLQAGYKTRCLPDNERNRKWFQSISDEQRKAYATKHAAWIRNKLATDPEFRDRHRENCRRGQLMYYARKKKRMEEDPVYAAEEIAKRKEQNARRLAVHKRRMQEDPVYAAHYRERTNRNQKEYLKRKKEKKKNDV